MPARIKLQAIIGAEKVITPIAYTGFFTMIIGLMLGPGRKSFHLVSHETSLVLGFGVGGGILLLAGLLWLLIDDYYVIEKQSGRLLAHRGFRFYGTESTFLEAGQVVAVGMNCFPKRGKYRQIGWFYAPVLLTQDGREIKLSTWSTNMDCSRLDEYNRRTRQWAQALKCRWIECPSGQDFSASNLVNMIQDQFET